MESNSRLIPVTSQRLKDLFIVPQKWPVQITVHDSVRTIFLLLCGKKKSGQSERVLDPFFEPIQIGHMSLSLSRVGFGTLSVSVPVTSRRALCHTTLRMCICMSLYRIRVEMYTHVT